MLALVASILYGFLGLTLLMLVSGADSDASQRTARDGMSSNFIFGVIYVIVQTLGRALARTCGLIFVAAWSGCGIAASVAASRGSVAGRNALVALFGAGVPLAVILTPRFWPAAIAAVLDVVVLVLVLRAPLPPRRAPNA